MILFMILAIIATVLVLFAVLTLGIGGGLLTIIFSDVIVCIFIIGLLIYWIFFRNR